VYLREEDAMQEVDGNRVKRSIRLVNALHDAHFLHAENRKTLQCSRNGVRGNLHIREDCERRNTRKNQETWQTTVENLTAENLDKVCETCFVKTLSLDALYTLEDLYTTALNTYQKLGNIQRNSTLFETAETLFEVEAAVLDLTEQLEKTGFDLRKNTCVTQLEAEIENRLYSLRELYRGEMVLASTFLHRTVLYNEYRFERNIKPQDITVLGENTEQAALFCEKLLAEVFSTLSYGDTSTLQEIVEQSMQNVKLESLSQLQDVTVQNATFTEEPGLEKHLHENPLYNMNGKNFLEIVENIWREDATEKVTQLVDLWVNSYYDVLNDPETYLVEVTCQNSSVLTDVERGLLLFLGFETDVERSFGLLTNMETECLRSIFADRNASVHVKIKKDFDLNLENASLEEALQSS